MGGLRQLLGENVVPTVIFPNYYRSLGSDLNSLRNWWLRGQNSVKTFQQNQSVSPPSPVDKGNFGQGYQDQNINSFPWLDPWHFPTAMSGTVQ